jgi:RNA polymerase sigma-70 factor, ECF subfamily
LSRTPFSTSIRGVPGDNPRVEEVLGAVERANVQAEPDVAAVHAAHGEYVWLTLQRFGVAGADLEDAFQEVFIVVQRKLELFDHSCELTTWLYGICRRVAAATRRRAHRRREHPVEAGSEDVEDPALNPEEAAAVRQADALLARALDAMDLDLRAALVMFELDGLSCAQIATLSGVAIGTVYARLHAARKELARALERMNAGDARRGLR